jgi:hypothetical protein
MPSSCGRRLGQNVAQGCGTSFSCHNVRGLLSTSVRSNDLPRLGIDEDVDLAATRLDLDHADTLAALSFDCYVTFPGVR